MSEEGYPQFVPFLEVIGDADPYCFAPDQKIVRWSHEQPNEAEPVEQSFSQVLMFEIQELEERKNEQLWGNRSPEKTI